MSTINEEFINIQEARRQLASALVTKFGVQETDILNEDGTVKSVGLHNADGTLKRLQDWATLVTATQLAPTSMATLKFKKGEEYTVTYDGTKEETVTYSNIGAAAASHTHSSITYGKDLGANLTLSVYAATSLDGTKHYIKFNSTNSLENLYLGVDSNGVIPNNIYFGGIKAKSTLVAKGYAIPDGTKDQLLLANGETIQASEVATAGAGGVTIDSPQYITGIKTFKSDNIIILDDSDDGSVASRITFTNKISDTETQILGYLGFNKQDGQAIRWDSGLKAYTILDASSTYIKDDKKTITINGESVTPLYANDIKDKIDKEDAVTEIGASKSAGKSLSWKKGDKAKDEITIPFATAASYLQMSTISANEFDASYENFKVSYQAGSNGFANNPEDNNGFGLMQLRVAAGYSGQIALTHKGGLYTRTGTNSAFSSSAWRKIADSSNSSISKDQESDSQDNKITILDNSITLKKLAFKDSLDQNDVGTLINLLQENEDISDNTEIITSGTSVFEDKLYKNTAQDIYNYVKGKVQSLTLKINDKPTATYDTTESKDFNVTLGGLGAVGLSGGEEHGVMTGSLTTPELITSKITSYTDNPEKQTLSFYTHTSGEETLALTLNGTNAFVSGKLTANKLIVDPENQGFLCADGEIDNNTYSLSTHQHDHLQGEDHRSVNNTPDFYMTKGVATVYTEFAKEGGAVDNTYANRTTFIPWGDSSGQRPVQLEFNDKGAYIRTSKSDSEWNTWEHLATQEYLAKYLTSFMNWRGNIAANTIPTSNVKVGDAYRISSAGTLSSTYSASGADERLEVGDIIICTDATTPKYAVAQTNWTTVEGEEDLTWGTSVTLGAVGGLGIKAKLPANPGLSAVKSLSWIDSQDSTNPNTLKYTLGNDTSQHVKIGYATYASYLADNGAHKETASGTASNDPAAGMLYSSGMYMTETYMDSATPCDYGNILNMAGLGTGQLLLGWSGENSKTGNIYYRSHRNTSGGGWGTWEQVAFISNIPAELPNPEKLTIFGKDYDGTEETTIYNTDFVSTLYEGTSAVTDGTMFVTSYAGNSGFDTSDYTNIPYKRKASHLWEYIKGKTDVLYSTIEHNHDSSYVSELDTKGNQLTWTKGATVNSITVPFANKAGAAVVYTGHDLDTSSYSFNFWRLNAPEEKQTAYFWGQVGTTNETTAKLFSTASLHVAYATSANYATRAGSLSDTYYWANVPISTNLSTATTPRFGQVCIGTETDTNCALSVYGDAHFLARNSRIYFGDAQYVCIGESGSNDTDALLCFGDKGIVLNTKDNGGYKVTSNSYIKAKGFIHEDHENEEYILTSNGGAIAKSALAGPSITVDTELSSTSTNPVQNQAIYSALKGKVDADDLTDFLKYLGTSSIGSRTQGIYWNGTKFLKMLYGLGADVSEGHAGKLAYYSSLSKIDAASGTIGDTWSPIYIKEGEVVPCQNITILGVITLYKYSTSGSFYASATGGINAGYPGYSEAVLYVKVNIPDTAYGVAISTSSKITHVQATLGRLFKPETTSTILTTPEVGGKEVRLPWVIAWFDENYTYTGTRYTGNSGYVCVRACKKDNENNASTESTQGTFGLIASIYVTVFGQIYHTTSSL